MLAADLPAADLPAADLPWRELASGAGIASMDGIVGQRRARIDGAFAGQAPAAEAHRGLMPVASTGGLVLMGGRVSLRCVLETAV